MTPPTTLSSRLAARYWPRAALILLLALIIYLLGNNLFPLVDRDEPRYAQTSRQMLQTGDWITPHFLDSLRLKKPILIYWLQTGSMKWLGDTAFAARFPSVVASLLTLFIFALTWPHIVGYRRALWGVFIFATMLMPTYLAKVCMTDGVLHLFIAMSMLCLYSIWVGKSQWWILIVMGLALGGSLLTKGPPAFLFVGMTLLALWVLAFTVKRDEPTRPIAPTTFFPKVFVGTLLVLGIALGVCVPWAMKLDAAHPGALLNMFFDEVVKRGNEAQEGHTGPPGFYFVTFWGMAFPWCLLWPAAIWHGWKRRRILWVRFCLAAILGPWVFLEIYKTKLPHYWLPSYPFMAMLIADVLVRAIRGRISDLSDRLFLIATGVVAAVIGCAGVGLLFIPSMGDGPRTMSYLSAGVLCLAILTAAWGVFELFRRRDIARAAIVMGLSFWIILTFAFTLFVPATPALTLAKRVGQSLQAMGATRDIVMIGYKEPSLAFYQGGTIREQSRNALPDVAAEAPSPRWVVISDDILKNQGDDRRSAYTIVRSFRGLNIADDARRIFLVHVLERKNMAQSQRTDPQ